MGDQPQMNADGRGWGRDGDWIMRNGGWVYLARSHATGGRNMEIIHLQHTVVNYPSLFIRLATRAFACDLRPQLHDRFVSPDPLSGSHTVRSA